MVESAGYSGVLIVTELALKYSRQVGGVRAVGFRDFGGNQQMDRRGKACPWTPGMSLVIGNTQCTNEEAEVLCVL